MNENYRWIKYVNHSKNIDYLYISMNSMKVLASFEPVVGVKNLYVVNPGEYLTVPKHIGSFDEYSVDGVKRLIETKIMEEEHE